MKSLLDLETGRAAQKLRTRQALLAAARALMSQAEPLSIAAVADKAGISRATAYRYFAAPETLAMEAALDVGFASAPEVIGEEPDARERVRLVARYLFSATAANEQSFRLFLAKALEASVQTTVPQLRGARRLPMYELALAPVRQSLGETQFATLVHALSGATGLEAFIALRDVCDLNVEAAETVMLLTVEAVLDAFLKDLQP